MQLSATYGEDEERWKKVERTELITHLEHLAEYVKYSEDAPALWEAIALLKTHEKRTETHARVLISMADVDQTVEDNILYYTHSDRPIDQDPDTECHKAIRTALKMLRKDLRKLSPAQPEQTDCEYCHEDSDGFVRPIEKNSHAFVSFGLDGWHIAMRATGWVGRAPIKFCPMCGRRLTDG